MCKFCRTQWNHNSCTETETRCETRCAAQKPLLIEEKTAYFGLETRGFKMRVL